MRALDRRWAAVAALTLGLAWHGGAAAQDGGADPARAPRPLREGEAMPPGHPMVDPGESASPHGDPHGGDPHGADPHAADPHGGNPHGDPHGADPHAADPHGGSGGMFRPPPDRSEEDGSLPAGTIHVNLRDPDGKPLPAVDVTLGILQNSVAKGESRKHVFQRTSAEGKARFDKLETGSAIAYRVSVVRDGATFAAMPFQLPLDKGMQVILHVYPVTSDVEEAQVVMQAALYAELKDDRIQLEQAINVFNFGKTAWVPKDLVLEMPQGFTAVSGAQSMSDQGVDAVADRGVRLRGTFGPGQHSVGFRWQLPYSGESTVNLRVGMPPHVAAARVMTAAAQQMQLSVEGFNPAMPNVDGQGGRLLETQKELRRGDPPLRELVIALRDIPTPGPARFLATGLAALGLFFGLAYAYNGRNQRAQVPKDDVKRARQKLLFELEELERAHATGDIGPKFYAATRRKLIDDLARSL